MHLSRKSIWMVVLILVVTAVSGLAQAVDGPKLSDEKLKSKLEKIIIPEVKFEKSDIQTVLDYLRKQSEMLDPEKKGVPLVLAPLTREHWTVTIDSRNISFGKALDQICGKSWGKWTIENGTVVISQKNLYVVSTVIYYPKASNDNGKKLLDLINKMPNASRSDITDAAGKENVLSSPRISAGSDQRMEIHMVRDISYQEETKDGGFVWKKTSSSVELNLQETRINDLKDGRKLSPGIRILMTVYDTAKSNYVTMNYLLCMTVVKDCKIIPGTQRRNMVIETFQTNGSMTLELDKWSLVDKQVECVSGGEQIKISMLVKINLYKPEK